MPRRDADSKRIQARHPDIPQDPLPEMPAPDPQLAKKPRKASTKPAWRRLKFGKTKRPPRCPYCVNEVTLDGETIVRPVVWRRSVNGQHDDMCSQHAEPQKAEDDKARRKERLNKARRNR